MFWLLLCLLPSLATCAAGGMLMGLQIDYKDAAGKIDDATIKDQISDSMAVLLKMKDHFTLERNVSLFACLEPGAPAWFRSIALNTAYAYEIQLYIGYDSFCDICTLCYPDLESHDALLHLAAFQTLDLFAYKAAAFTRQQFVAPTAHIRVAKELYRSFHGNLSMTLSSLSKILLDQLQAEQFDLETFLFLPSRTETIAAVPGDGYPLFAPSASRSAQSSGPCTLHWPRNGTIVYALTQVTQALFLWENWVIDCDFERHPQDDFFLLFEGDNVGEGYDKAAFQKKDLVNPGEFVLPWALKTWGEDAAGNLVVRAALVSNRGNVASYRAKFTVRFKVIRRSNLPAPSLAPLNPMIAQAPFQSFLGSFFNGLQLVGTFVEVGFLELKFTKDLLQQWKGNTYFSLVTSGRAEDANIVGLLLKEFDQLTLLRGSSAFATKLFLDEAVDIICIHELQYHEQLMEMQLWWPKLKPGGVMFGRMYPIPYDHNYQLSKSRYSTGPAVDEFALKMNIPKFSTRDGTWYVLKPIRQQ